MAITVNLAGTNYVIPETGETGWGDELTSYLVALSNSLLSNNVKFKTRVVSLSPVTALADDVVLVWNGAAPTATINLPAGVDKKVYIIHNKSLTTTNIDVSAADPIGPSTTYSIRDRYGFLFIVFDGSRWCILSESRSNLRPSVYFDNSLFTNPSFVESSVTATTSFPSVLNNQSCSADFLGSEIMYFSVSIYDATNRMGLLCSTDYNSGLITCLSDKNNIFLTQDAGVGFYISKLANSSSIVFKSRLVTPYNVEIKAMTNRIANVTNWS